MKTLTIFIVSMLLATITNASDFYRNNNGSRNSCIKERWTLLNTEVESFCQEAQPLKLSSMLKNYPLMNIGPLKVRYWEGKFLKVTNTVKTYEHSYVNVCSGVKTYTEQLKSESQSYDYFRIFNPNLSDEIEQSFETAPMTEAEAKISMIELEKLCNK